MNPTLFNIREMPVPQEPHTQMLQEYADCHSRTVYIIDREVPFPDGEIITSRTDLNGIITHANEAFVLMSGWRREEIIGQPHSILRHPFMPKVAFADLWNTIQQGRKWYGYVKNLRKDGAYYWVYATVIPNIRQGKIQGYTSVRRRAPTDKIAEMSEMYQSLKMQERKE